MLILQRCLFLAELELLSLAKPLLMVKAIFERDMGGKRLIVLILWRCLSFAQIKLPSLAKLSVME